MADKTVDHISEMLSAPPLSGIPSVGQAVATCPAVSPADDRRQGVLMAIDDIDKQLNYYDQLAHSLRNNGNDTEAQEVKDMANSERKNKIRLREILRVLENS